MCGDIETNPGSKPNILETHPSTHKRRYKTYFIPCTIKLQPEYQHLAKKFSPILNTIHPNHQNANIEYLHLSKYIYQNIHHLPPRILFAIITILSPTLETCDHMLIQIPNPDWTTPLLE